MYLYLWPSGFGKTVHRNHSGGVDHGCVFHGNCFEVQFVLGKFLVPKSLSHCGDVATGCKVALPTSMIDSLI